ncbi:MAG: flagellar basal body-associated FliL family protein, partial [Candidatus Cloacimonadota bacterium]|nr:flagellar basal body-associated FliL family protein [Candidatus Cloacimonadota bacterium]
ENKDLQEILSTALPDIRANILSLLRRESIQDLEDVTYTKKLGTKIKNRINQVIQNKEQEAGIEYVLFTQFIIE